MKRFLIGFSMQATFFAAIFCLGSFRQFLEKRYNDGHEYSIVFNFLSRRSGIFYEVDDSIPSVLIDGLFTLFAVCLCLVIFYIFVQACIELGDKFLKKSK